jgi:nucleoside-diphosphate-sugar epimerase
MRIAVTGGSGKLGKWVLQRLKSEGNQVTNFDRAGGPSAEMTLLDLCDYGQVVDSILQPSPHRGFMLTLQHFITICWPPITSFKR